MSNIQRHANILQIVQQVGPEFAALANIHGAVVFAREALFATQILEDNDYLMDIAVGAPDSLRRAILSVATIGLSLNPVLKLAYLVPRKKKVILDISYKGYEQLAYDSGAVKWIAAEIVREKDKFEFTGVNREPLHQFQPFGDRGEIMGAYCIAKTHNGEFITTIMNNDEIKSIRDRSESYKSFIDKGKATPWETDTTEMIKKTVIRRASKSWPKTNTRTERFAAAIEIGNDIDFSAPVAVPPIEDKRAPGFKTIRDLLVTTEKTESELVAHLTRVTRRELKTLDDLTDIEIQQTIAQLKQMAVAKTPKDKNEKPA